ncbi:MAG: LysR family transcriptional regulator [Pseudomonadota bacterium]
MSQPTDRLTLLATFARIAERGSISAAARDLGLSQASASRQLAALEQRIGAPLITRTTHDLSLTEAGRACLVDARSLLSAWEALAERFDEARDAPLRGRIRVVAPVALGQRALARSAADFLATHPGVSLSWLLDDRPVRMAELGADLWIKIGEVTDDTLVVRSLGRVERLVVSTPALFGTGRPSDPTALADVPMVAVEPFEGTRVQLVDHAGREAPVAARAVFSTDNIVAARTAVFAGAGWAVLPRWFVDAELLAGRLIDALPAWRAPKLTLNAALLPVGRRPRRVNTFAEHVAKEVMAIPGVLPPDVGEH